MSSLDQIRLILLNLSWSNSILRVDGPFALKSGRLSPYFFNAGLFNSGNSLLLLAKCYAEMIMQSNIRIDMIFGPAYKGIPLAASVAVVLKNDFNIDVGFAYNRKETKDHGEGGKIVGAPLRGNILILDDVITAGTAIREAANLIDQSEGAKLAGICVTLDRRERISEKDSRSTAEAISAELKVPVLSLINFDMILSFIENQELPKDTLEQILRYRDLHGAY